MELYIQRVYTLFYCVLVAASLILYFWFQDQKGSHHEAHTYADFKWPVFDWFIGHFLVVLLEIVLCFLLQKKVGKSYIKTYRWLKPNREVTKRKGRRTE
jgi:hypothetical protein